MGTIFVMPRRNGAEILERAISDFPKHSFANASRVALTIEQNNGGRPLPPAEIAIGLGSSPGSSDFRVLLSSSIKYGLTSGSYNQERVTLTELGRRIVAPTSDEDCKDAIQAAVLHSVTFRRMYEHFRSKKLPEDSFFENVVVREFDVPRSHSAKCIKIFRENMEYAGLLRQATTGTWLVSQQSSFADSGLVSDADTSPTSYGSDVEVSQSTVSANRLDNNVVPVLRTKPLKVFISHSKNMEIVGQIKTMLNVAEVAFDVAVEQESTAIPVPEKVFAAMRGCTAAVICVTADDGPVKSDFQLNQNVLIEIGAAFVLYDRKVILVWDKRLPVPSNLQGLYRCEFEGSELSWSKGMKLMETIKQFKAEK